jgi:Spy/CpxP family protein refolding chaperone
MDRALGLTDVQREEIRKLREEHRAAVREEAQKFRDASRQLRAEIYAANPDQGKIDSLKAEVAQLSQQLHLRRLEQQERISRILTPEQRQLMLERRQFLRGFREGRADRMRGNARGREFRMRQFRQWQ